VARVSEGFVIDTPGGIELYRILATYHGLKMEVAMTARGWSPKGCPTRGMAFASAKRMLDQYKVKGPCGTRRTALRTMAKWLKDHQLIQESN
jgi:hypothetical protein